MTTCTSFSYSLLKNKLPKAGLVFAFLCTVFAIFGCGAERNIRKGEKFLALGEYHDASVQFKKAYQNTSPKERTRRGEIAAKMALCYNRLSASQRAIAAYRNVVRYKLDDGETHRLLADNLMRNGSYTDAAKEYQIALDARRQDGFHRTHGSQEGIGREGDEVKIYREEDGRVQLAPAGLFSDALWRSFRATLFHIDTQRSCGRRAQRNHRR